MGPQQHCLLPVACVLGSQRERKVLTAMGKGSSAFLSPNQCRWRILGLQEASYWEQGEPAVLGSGQGLRRVGLT